MSKQAPAKKSRSRSSVVPPELVPQQIVLKADRTPLAPKTDAQKRYMSAIRSYKLVFGLGPAGTGKTYVAAAMAAEWLDAQHVERIIITRPAVEAGQSMGFIPGDIDEKYAPYLNPFRDVFDQRLGKSYVECLMKNGKIEAAPLAYMRGRTFRDAVVILDEAQNATSADLKMFLTRIGENCRVIVNGDASQADIGNSGLIEAVRRTSWIPDVKVVEFLTTDIVRSGLVQDIVTSYSQPLEHFAHVN